MAGGGGYPIMSDIEWSRAPWNQPEIECADCPHCNGEGGIWVNDDGDVIDSADYKRLSDEDKSLFTFERCEYCKGDGYIEVEPYGVDYDNYD